MPVYNEGPSIIDCLDRLFEAVQLPCEVLAIFDSVDDSTVPHLRAYAASDERLLPLLNTYGPGPANAIRFGFDHVNSPVTVVTMADGSDDPQQIDQLVRLVERGVVVAAASRYTTGGQQVGGPFIKGLLSRVACRSLYWLARVGTRDATNSFKAYSKKFVEEVGIDSAAGFELGLEMTAKARRLRLPIAEIPTIWLDRQAGASNFQIAAWLPNYLRWYFFAFGRRITSAECRAQAKRYDAKSMKAHRKGKP